MPELLASLREALGERYRLEGELGRGGMATVYRARDLKHQRDVAVKVVDSGLASMIGVERFQREIDIAATLQHPGIVPLFDSGGAGELLFYIMPLIAGESLRERMRREAQLPLAEALAITREVADALSHAHGRGIVHRDIKPENIMLSAGRAMVADFGIARAISEAGGSRLTGTGLAIGTPAYMSPEQAGAESQIDGRSDVYALGCVLYEMLAGEPPFTGRTAQAILARQLQERPPSLQVVRPTVSLALQQVIEKALAKVPADRFQTAAEFASAAEAAAAHLSATRVRTAWDRRAALWGTAAGILVVAASVLVYFRFGPPAQARMVPADTSHYAILPFEHDRTVTAAAREDQLLHDALSKWSGIRISDQVRVRDALSHVGGALLNTRDAQRVALQLGAGRYVRGDVSRLGDSLRVHAGLYEASSTGGLLRESSAKVAFDLRGADAVFAAVADSLLFGGAGPGVRPEARTGTRSVPARQSYARGDAAVVRWDLVAADSAYNRAATYDSEYASAFLWLAQVRSWSGKPVATWRSAAARAATGRPGLSPRDQLLSDALLALGGGDVERACGLWRQLAASDARDFASWFGLGHCLSHDDVVLRDPVSPSRWRFRTSYHEAISAYERAFQLSPSMLRSLRGRSYEPVRRLFKTSRSALRSGHAAAPDTLQFGAYPLWQGDTLAFIPYPRQELFSGPRPASEATSLAIRHERERFRQIAVAWVTELPRSSDALEALAVSLEILGDASALDTLRRARSLAATPEDRVRVAGAEVWMRARLSIPSDMRGLQAARSLADSLLGAYPPGAAPEPLLLASLAALVGRSDLAAAYASQAEVAAESDIPAPLARSAYPLLATAALGGPTDSIRVLEQRVDSTIQTAIQAPSRPEARKLWLARAATLALPQYRFHSMAGLIGLGDFFLDAQAGFVLRGDTSAVRRMFAGLKAGRRLLPPADVTLDALYPEAQLLAMLGDPQSAIAWLDPTLAALSSADPYAFADPVRAASLVRAMVLRADLADHAGDHSAARTWAGAVGVLWSNSDPFLRSVTRRMQALGR